MTIPRAAAVAAALTIALAGCGGSSNKQLSYSSFISKANGICRAGQAAFSHVQSADKAAPVLEKYVKQFKDLKPPDALKKSYDRFVAVSDQQVALLKKGDVKGYNHLNRESNLIASQMGAQDCISEG